MGLVWWDNGSNRIGLTTGAGDGFAIIDRATGSVLWEEVMAAIKRGVATPASECGDCKRRILFCLCCDDCGGMKTLTSYGTCTCDYALGDITGDRWIDIFDALEILKYLAGMESRIQPNTRAFRAALITEAEQPTIFDALEILKYIARMDSKLDPENRMVTPW
jgi:hypothetical protein